MEEKFKIKIFGATHGHSPNYGGVIKLNKSNEERHYKELHFYVSLIFNYFSIQIVEADNFMIHKREHLPDSTI